MMRVFVREVEFQGLHGVYEEERREGRRFQVDLEVLLGDSKATSSDVLEETLDYRALAEVVWEVAQGPSRFLVEKLAGEILEETLARHPEVEEATVEVRKRAPDVVGEPRWVGVRLTRARTGDGAQARG
jgi:7,8-dihydroneopterin aldolase/epimerase/oxygenase